MREIKFRAWDKEKHKMFEVGQIDWRGFLLKKKGRYKDSIWKSPDEVELMQFTGLKDKNGKEIYEGDIVRDVGDETLSQVVFADAAFWFSYSEIPQKVGENRFTYDWAKEHNAWGKMEVIGNIYETPELLSK